VSCNGRRVTELLGGPAAADHIRGAVPGTSVTAYRIDGMARIEGRTGGKSLHGYPILAGPVQVDATSQAELADVLLSDDTYLWDISKACEFLPGVLFRYESGGSAEATVDVLICFSCDELEVYVGSKQTGHEDFDPRRKDLVRIAQRLFPADKAIQKLK
jgi:hypothetical protein